MEKATSNDYERQSTSNDRKDLGPTELESRQAGRQGFDKIADRIFYRSLYFMSGLDESHRDWAHVREVTDLELEEWEDESHKYDRDAFVKGFFERLQEVNSGLEARISETNPDFR